MASLLEDRTIYWGRELFSRLHPPLVFPLGPTWWENRVMALSLADPDLKVQLFRFVDVLPMLHGPGDIRRHLVEYISEARKWSWLGHMASFIPTWGFLGGIVQWTTQVSASRMARKFIVGSTRKETISRVLDLRHKGFAHTLDVLGESTLTQSEANGSFEEYLLLIRDISDAMGKLPANPLLDRDGFGSIPKANVSIKVSALTPTFDPTDPEGTIASVLPFLRILLREARDKGVFVNFDMEQYSSKDLLIRLVMSLLTESEFREGPDCGIAIQAYLRGTANDLVRLRDWARRTNRPLTVRLVKGAYWDFETVFASQNDWPVPVWQIKDESDLNYETLAGFLVENRRWLRPAFASHNVRSLAHAIALGEQSNLEPNEIEFQSLFGMGEPVQNALKAVGRRVRVYAPYGELIPGMAYLVRRLLENTANDSFLRQSSGSGCSEDSLLQNPKDKLAMKNQNKSIDSPAKSTNGNAPEERLKSEALLDFSREENRTHMISALKSVRGELGKFWPAKISGKEISTGMEILSNNPSQMDEVVGRVASCGVPEAIRAVEACKAFQSTWASTPVEKRTGALRKAADLMLGERFNLCAWMVLEVGKSWREADADVAEAIDFCRYYAQQMEELSQPLDRGIAGESNQTFRMAKGISLVIAPWNFPLAILCGMTAASLAAGCTTIMKPAEQSSVIAALLHRIFLKAGIPAEALAFVPGVGEEIGPALVSHPDVALIAFTGSLTVGAKIYAQASQLVPGQTQFKRVLAEMGGKNAIIIDDDADLDEAIRGVLASSYGFQGQKCSAASRAYIPSNIAEAVKKKLTEGVKSFQMGSVEDFRNFINAVIDEKSFDNIKRYIDAAKKDPKCQILVGGKCDKKNGYFIQPTVIETKNPRSLTMCEEIFGPVLTIYVYPAGQFEKALDLVDNTSPYALTGSILSQDRGAIDRATTRLRHAAGNFYINDKPTGAVVGQQPFGGARASGTNDKAGSMLNLLRWLSPRTIKETFNPPTDYHYPFHQEA